MISRLLISEAVIALISIFVLSAVGQSNAGEGITTSDMIILPTPDDSIPKGACDEVRIGLPDNFCGILVINQPYVSLNKLGVYLKQCVDTTDLYPQFTIEDEPYRSCLLNSDLKLDSVIMLTPVFMEDNRECVFALDTILSEGKWELHIPAGYFEVRPEFIETDSIPFSKEQLTDLAVAGAWHKPGRKWDMPPMFSIHDDDGIDGEIPSSGAMRPGCKGYFSLLFPLLESLGVRGNVSMEGQRCGLVGDSAVLNDNGRILLRLEKEKGWEAQAHSMEVLGQMANNWYVDSLTSETADEIYRIATKKGIGQNIVSVYDASANRQYFPTDDSCRWMESPKRLIKPYVYDYQTGKVLFYNSEHDVDYHWGEWFRRAKASGFKATAWVQHNAIASHDYTKSINGYCNNGFSDMVPPYQYNVPPLRSTLTRMMLEGQSAPGYQGESNTDNTFDSIQFEWFKDYIDRCVEENGWIIFGMHTYRRCWDNYLPGSLISEGGFYPDEWVDPMSGVDPLDDPLTPPARLGFSEWSEWYPCPGTRLYMVWELIRYAIDKGMINVTSSEGFNIMGNRVMAGYYNGGVRIGMDRYKLTDDRDIYPHYVESATGEESYYNPLVTDSVAYSFKIYRNSINTDVRPVNQENNRPMFRRYFNINGEEIKAESLGRGLYIMIDETGSYKIIR